MVAVADHDGDLDAPAAAIEDGGRSFWSGAVEAKFSQLNDLRHRLTEAGIDAAKLAGDADADPRARDKARTKVLNQGLYPRDLTDAMRYTPRDRLRERALRGRWSLFPVSPEPFYERLANGLGEADDADRGRSRRLLVAGFRGRRVGSRRGCSRTPRRGLVDRP